ncbi:MAG: RloB family protein [Marinilabiliaceae bacterium]
MASRREKAPSKRMRRIALVICEGESEAGYVDLVRKWYKSPIRIITHVARQSINQGVVDKHAGDLKISDGDKVSVFLMYDMDVPAVNEKLKRCEAELLLSNPCFELWLLLHVKAQKSVISSGDAVKSLMNSDPVWRNYAKSLFTETQKSFLKKHLSEARERAKALRNGQNPSSQVYKLLDFLETEE